MYTRFVLLSLIVTFYKVSKGVYGIMGGTFAPIEDYPYQVSLHYNNELYCGGSLISKKIVLTAAHCVYKTDINQWKIEAGSSNINIDKPLETRNIDKIIVHESFKGKITPQYDIALLRLNTSFKTSKYIKIIPLVKKNKKLPISTVGVVTGYGREKEDGPCTEELRKINIPVLTDSDCKLVTRSNFSPNIYCAGHIVSDKKICKGDSGGPMVVNKKLVGIIQAATNCVPGSTGTSVFTNVSSFREWINTHMKTKNYYKYKLF